VRELEHQLDSAAGEVAADQIFKERGLKHIDQVTKTEYHILAGLSLNPEPG